MRTNIVLNDDLVREALRYSRATTKTGLVEEALQAFVKARAEEERRRTYQERLLDLQRSLATKRMRETGISILRAHRDRK